MIWLLGFIGMNDAFGSLAAIMHTHNQLEDWFSR